jgi:shikimate dehydrogenase
MLEEFVEAADQYGVELWGGGLDALDGLSEDEAVDVVINATSASLSSAMPPVPAAAFCHDTLALDMMYGKMPSPFMEFAASHGATTRDGLGMLVEQAAEAFAIWRGVRPQTATLLEHMRTRL